MNQIESANWRCYVLLRGALYCFILLCGALSCSAAIHSPSWCSGYDLVHRQCSVFLFLSHSGSADQRFTRFQFSGGFLQIIVIILTLSVTKSWDWDLVFNNINVCHLNVTALSYTSSSVLCQSDWITCGQCFRNAFLRHLENSDLKHFLLPTMVAPTGH